MRKPPTHLIAREGWIFIAGALLLGIVAIRLTSIGLVVFSLAAIVFLLLFFRDPLRVVPSAPLAILSPVDGRILSVEHTDRGCLDREATVVAMRVNNFGAYSARSPVEGRVLNLRDNYSAGSRLLGISGLWVRTDEDDDVVVLMNGPRWLRPVSFVGYGERLGQGRRFGFVRATRLVRVFIPISSRVDVVPGDYVRAGMDALAVVVHDRDKPV